MAFYDRISNKRTTEWENSEINSMPKGRFAYNRFFEGYDEEKVPRKNGKGYSIRRTYTAPWVVQKCSDAEWMRHKILLSLSFFASLAIFIYAGSRRVPGNAAFYAVVLGVFTFISFFLGLISLIRILISPRKMTLWVHRSSFNAFRSISVATAILLFALAAAQLINILLYGSMLRELAVRQLACIFGYVVAGALMTAAYIMERHKQYVRERQDKEYNEDNY